MGSGARVLMDASAYLSKDDPSKKEEGVPVTINVAWHELALADCDAIEGLQETGVPAAMLDVICSSQ